MTKPPINITSDNKKWADIILKDNKRGLLQAAAAIGTSEIATRYVKNSTAQTALMGAGAGSYIFDSFKAAKETFDEKDFADMMMHGLNGTLGTYGVLARDKEAIQTSVIMKLLFDISHEVQESTSTRYNNLRKGIAINIPGLPLLKHGAEGEEEGHSHDHDHGPTYRENESIDAFDLKLNAVEQARLTELLSHHDDYSFETIKKGYREWEKIIAKAIKNQDVSHDLLHFEEEYGFLIMKKGDKPFEFEFHHHEESHKEGHEHDHKHDAASAPFHQYELLFKNEQGFRDKLSNSIYVRELPKGKIQEVLAREIKKDDVIRVRPGQFIPADGKLTHIGGKQQGTIAIDTTAYTGDTSPDVAIGMQIFQTGRNGAHSPALTLKVIHDYSNSTGVAMLDGFKDKKNESKNQIWLKKVIENYMKLMLSAGGLLFFRDAVKKSEKGMYFDSKSLLSKDNIKKTFQFFVAAAPCPLAASMLVYRGLETELKDNGTVIQSREELINAKDTQVAIFDLVGTLTEGDYTINLNSDLIQGAGDKKKLLAVAARLEEGVPHSIANAILLAASKDATTEKELVALRNANDADAKSSKGIHPEITSDNRGRSGIIGGQRAYVGNIEYFREHREHLGHALPKTVFDKMEKEVIKYRNANLATNGDAVIVLKEGEKGPEWAVIGLNDKPRASARATLESLIKEKKEVVIATGSGSEKTQEVLAQLGFRPKEKAISDHHQKYMNDAKQEIAVFYDLKPTSEESKSHLKLSDISSKTDVINYYHQQKKRLMMTGDAVNDAGAMNLVTSHKTLPGVAIGVKSKAVGTIQHAAGIMVDDVDSSYRLIKLSEKLDKTVKTNVGISAGWMSFLVGLHFFTDKIKQWFGVDLGPLVMGFLHEGMTVLVAYKGGVRDADKLQRYYKDSSPQGMGA